MRLACVFAHPDDETFSVGGTIVHYAKRGAECVLYCATDGAAGRSSGIEVASREELAALRRRELAAACDVLGVSTIETPGHRDGQLPATDTEVLVAEVVAFLRRHAPDVVLTFGPEGAPTGHRDHRVISRVATTAFFLSGLRTEFPEQLANGLRPHAPKRLFYVAWPDPDPGAELPRLSVPATTLIDIVAYRETKLAAFMRHATQRDHLERFRQLGLTDTERFALAAGVPGARTDLFDGITR
jgi:LmbE family N-acetylglucosaminyl deacetylase